MPIGCVIIFVSINNNKGIPYVCEKQDGNVLGFSDGKRISPISITAGGDQNCRRDETPDHAYPFVVSIERSTDNFKYCGGTLITPTKVLTAAHCVYGLESIPTQIRAGTNNSTILKGQVRSVTNRVKHPKYDPNTTDYDVAILTLASPVSLSDNVNLVELPEASSYLQSITALTKAGTVVRSIGWGDTTEGGTPSDDLLQVDLPIVANTTCATALGATITARMMCAGYPAGGKDTCQGDSGGPLFGYLPSARAGLQTGIVSWGYGCAQPNLYGVYTRISNPEIRSFILTNGGV